MIFKTYFTARYVLSKHAIINLCLSDRSDGKTFDCKARALEDYEKSKDITIYCRRWKTELGVEVYRNFFSEVWENNENYIRFSKWEFRYSKSKIEVKTSKDAEWDTILYFIPLSVASRWKSKIQEIKRIKIIDYDEYIPMDNRYLPDETTLLLDLWKTIDRDREEVQIVICGNRIVPFAPILDYFNIDLKIDSKDLIRCYRNDTLAVQIYSNKEHREKREEGRFRELIKDTKYNDYDSGEVLYALDLDLKSHEGYEYFCQFKTERGSGTLWYKDGIFVVSEYKRKDGFIITDKNYNIVGEKFLCTYGKFPSLFKNVYKRHEMFFETERAFYIFEKILIKIGSVL